MDSTELLPSVQKDDSRLCPSSWNSADCFQIYFSNPSVKVALRSLAAGAAIQTISIKDLKEFRVPVPSAQEEKEIEAAFRGRQDRMRVKSHSVLTVTSRAKMRNARAMQLTYSGDLLQTIVFPNRKDDIAANFNAADRFISALGPSTDLNHQHFVPDGQKWNGHLWRDVSALSVISFLREYRTHAASFRIMSPLIADFIEEMNKDQELTDWTVALIGKDQPGTEKSVGGASVKMLDRRRASRKTGARTFRSDCVAVSTFRVRRGRLILCCQGR